MLFYLFTFAINLSHRKFVTADATAVFVNSQHGRVASTVSETVVAMAYSEMQRCNVCGMYSTCMSRCLPTGWSVCLSVCGTEVMDEVAQNVPILEKIVSEIEGLAESGGKYVEAPHVIEVTLPMLCRYQST